MKHEAVSIETPDGSFSATMVGATATLVGLSLVLIMLQLQFSEFMMRNSFDAVPRELDVSSQVVGWTRW